MRDNYVGDVGDFYKYGLLRYLTGQTANDSLSPLKFGVIWYLYPDPCKDTDGLHLDYLGDKLRDRFRPCDPQLYDALGKLVASNRRSVLEVQKRGILPATTDFFAEPLSFAGLPKGTRAAIDERLLYRQRWLNRALAATENADIIFCDPDNGLETKSTAIHQDKGAKFCFYEELAPFWQRGQSLIIYQHKNLHQTAAVQIANRTAELYKQFGGEATESVYFPAYGGRIFFLLVNKPHAHHFTTRLIPFKKKFRTHIRQ